MEKSKLTKKYRRRYIFLGILSFIAVVLPLLYGIFHGLFFVVAPVTAKIAFSALGIIAGLLCLFNIVKKYHLRSPFFLILLGLWYVLDFAHILLIWTSIGSIFDEFLFTPLKKSYYEEYRNNKSIDRREQEKEKKEKVREKENE